MNIDAVKNILVEYLYGSNHPDLVVYRKDFGEKFDLDYWLEGKKRTIRQSGFVNKRLLEVGCGFGWDAVAMSLLGDNEVVATDILPSMIDGMNECLASAEAKGHHLNIVTKVADICTIDLPDNSFDGVFSSEAIEHVHDLGAMFNQVHRLLKTNGRLMLVNDSNRFNSKFRESTFEMWAERDNSWEHAEWLKNEIRPVEHKNAKPYGAMREDIIRETGIAFDAVALTKLVAATAGMVREQIIEAAREFKNSNKLPTPSEFSWCRNPETGEYAERLLDPFELCSLLKAQKFRNVRMFHGFSRFPIRLLNGVRFKPLNKLLFDQRGLFIILADK